MKQTTKPHDTMDEQPADHRSVQAIQMKSVADRTNPSVKRDPRSDAVRLAKARISRRRSLQKQRDAQKT
jgi:hypothetical protein